ncbi:MAG: FtsW/RodA/SpoVE family cell cycle protein [Oscillospiraceae bacterium]|jgi:cell division protein FtsW|nr:FtsW/RodA/SpoVE family cell cycle protein [Oscillospiraceae bacterium]
MGAHTHTVKGWFKQKTKDKAERSPAVRKKVRGFDLSLFLILMALLIMGVIMMFSASYAKAASENLPGTHYMQRQVRMILIGLVLMFVLSYIDYRWYFKRFIALGSYLVCIGLLVAVLAAGVTEGGAQRWLVIFGINFQPSELMKLSIILSFSYFITKNYDKMTSFKAGIMPLMMMLVPVAGLMMAQPHLSGTILICLIGLTLMFVGGMTIKHLLAVGAVGGLGLVAVVGMKIMVDGMTYFQQRIQSWLDPFSDERGVTWQTCQSLIAIGSGGLFGLGLGESRQKYTYLPESHNDFVFSIVCEELGFVGAMVVVLLFFLFVCRGFAISTKAPDKFGMLLGVGLTVQIGLQAFMNIAVVSNLFPNTGISLPFFSYGGTAIIMQLAQVGILLNISRNTV